MILITWNVQWCRGCDGKVDPERIVRAARGMADFDVLCLQELARDFPGLEGSRGEDQFALIAEALPGFTRVEAIATDALAVDGQRSHFGNAIYSRLPVIQAFRHLLPWPADPAVPSMQRSAAEAVLDTASGPVRVTTTHLEYYSRRQRAAQVEALRALHQEAAVHAADPVDREKEGGPFRKLPRPRSSILTGDFNFQAEDPLHARLRAPIGGGVPAYADAWQVRHPGRRHDPTLGIFDKGQWPGASFACDFIFVSEDLVPRVREVKANLETAASDHQPVLLRLD